MTSRRILLTGATGNMGSATLDAFAARDHDVAIRALALPSERAHPVVQRYSKDRAVEFVWGDLRDKAQVKAAVDGCDMVLHVGGLVSPLADHHPELTMAVNVGGAANIVDAIKAQPAPDQVSLVYIGTVAQTGHRPAPIHWGRTGDPIKISRYDTYARSKTEAEAIVADSGLTRWVSLRQTGIAHPNIWKTFDPIMFHSPFNDVLEWITVEDAGKLMACVALDPAPETFWRRFYNIGGGGDLRVMNHEFAAVMSRAGGGDFRKTMDARLFARRNFHGQWYSDSHRLAEYFPFKRQGLADLEAMMSRAMPWIAKAVSTAAPGLVRRRIHGLAEAPGGPLYWEAQNDRAHLDAYFGEGLSPSKLPTWSDFPLTQASRSPTDLDHGYDETTPLEALTTAELDAAARFRGLRLDGPAPQNPYAKATWRDREEQIFEMSPNLLLRGGHWHRGAMFDQDRYEALGAVSPFLKQVLT